MPRTELLNAKRAKAWGELRFVAAWEGESVPGHEEGRRIVAAARRHACSCVSGCPGIYAAAMSVIDPTGKAFPVVIDLVWAARKANA